MQIDNTALRDEIHVVMDRQRRLVDESAIVGFGVATLLGPDGQVKQRVPFANLVTDAGDLYYAGKGIVGISPAAPAAPTAVNGMKLGTGSTAVAKSGAGAALVTYLAGSNAAFSASYPQTANLGAGLGVNMVYRSAWAAGVATGTLTEVVIVNDQATNATTTAANTIARSVFGTAIVKAAGDSLSLDWAHKVLGA